MLIVGVAVAALALTAVLGVVVKPARLTPEGVLAQYASAIRTGDLALADSLTATTASIRPLSGDVLSAPEDRITHVTTAITSHRSHSATGTVSFQLDGRRDRATVTLAEGPAQVGILPDWRVATPLAAVITLAVPAAGTAVVNGQTAALASDGRLVVYPGRYVVGLAAGNHWYTSSTVTVSAGTGTVTASPTVTPTAALNAEVLTQVTSVIGGCVTQATPTPQGCPFADRAAQGTITGFAWHLDTGPQVTFLDATHFFLTGGQVTAHYTESYSYIVNKQEDDPIPIQGAGVVTFHGTSVVATLAVG